MYFHTLYLYVYSKRNCNINAPHVILFSELGKCAPLMRTCALPQLRTLEMGAEARRSADVLKGAEVRLRTKKNCALRHLRT